jgi:AcrR family transcriptional regulator
MARPREFDSDQALERAMRIFWAHGYRATSVQDLMEAAGVQKQSLYGAFGDKRSLFLKCLRLYTQQTLLQVARMLNATTSPMKGIERVMQYASRRPEAKSGPVGCLMANTALEMGARDPEVLSEVRRMFRGFEKLFASAVRRAQEHGEIGTSLDSVAVAQSLTNTINGIRILEKTGASQQQIQTVVEMALDILRR